ncbi:hypothetical protein C8R43DRAFT_1025982 [Mycena crocata]|nr:hypothetical protein C8R43DRAFT_1025982 [Mycena crocata]
MLKRLRPVSPSPSAPTVPLVSDPSDSYRPEPKRRRILPPSLDGQSRHSRFRTDEDDEDDDDDDDINPSVGYSGPSGSTMHNTEYSSANTFLHDLHALHRHRLIFSAPTPSFPLPQLSPVPHYPDKSYLPIPDDSAPNKSRSSGVPDLGCKLPFEEVQSVKERYEDTNKLLGSLVLTRRKQLDPSQHNT